MSHLPAYNKTIAALVGAIITWGSTAQSDGIQAAEWWGLAAALATVLGVYQVTNERDEGDTGQSVLGIVIAILLILLLLRLLGAV